jgi:hypothetical protein
MGNDEVHAQCELARNELKAAETSNVPATLVAVAICVTKCMEAIAGGGAAAPSSSGGGGSSGSESGSPSPSTHSGARTHSR